MKVFISTNFIRKYKKLTNRNIKLKNIISDKLKLFKINPYNPTLRIHKLKSDEINEWSISLGYDLRLIFQPANGDIILVDIGSHNEV